MKKILFILAAILMLSSCGVTYYTYYEIDSCETATAISAQDALWAKDYKTPSRCVTAYRGEDGKMVYLMETKITRRKK